MERPNLKRFKHFHNQITTDIDLAQKIILEDETSLKQTDSCFVNIQISFRKKLVAWIDRCALPAN
jgi:hypothetical protein